MMMKYRINPPVIIVVNKLSPTKKNDLRSNLKSKKKILLIKLREFDSRIRKISLAYMGVEKSNNDILLDNKRPKIIWRDAPIIVIKKVVLATNFLVLKSS